MRTAARRSAWKDRWMLKTLTVNSLPPAVEAARHGVAYRHETEEDRGFLMRLYRSAREAELARTLWSEEEKQAFTAMQFRAQRSHYRQHYPDALWLIIEAAGQPAGRLYLERWEKEHRIIDVALLPERRGQGLGGAILRDLQGEAAEQGKPVGIHVEKENPAMTLYRRLGFRKTEDKGVYDLMHWQPPG